MLKRYVFLVLVVGLVLVLAPDASAYSGTYVPGAGINGTAHDLSIPGANGMNYGPVPADAQTRVCIFCHAPHNTIRLAGAPGGVGPLAPAAFDYLPLWNHDLTGFTSSFTMYENGPGAPQVGPKALNAAFAAAPGSSSLLCLSCHDGSIAVNSYGNSAQLSSSVSAGTTFITSQYRIGQDGYLGNHHPIGFNYDDVQAVDTDIRNADQLCPRPSQQLDDGMRDLPLGAQQGEHRPEFPAVEERSEQRALSDLPRQGDLHRSVTPPTDGGRRPWGNGRPFPHLFSGGSCAPRLGGC